MIDLSARAKPFIGIFKDIKKSYRNEFYQQIILINLSRIRIVTPLLLVLSLIFFIIIDIVRASALIISPKMIIYSSLNIFFLLVMIFMRKVKGFSSSHNSTGFLFLYFYIFIIMLHVMALAIFASNPELSIYYFLVPLLAMTVGFYWPLFHLLIFHVVASIEFLLLSCEFSVALFHLDD